MVILKIKICLIYSQKIHTKNVVTTRFNPCNHNYLYFNKLDNGYMDSPGRFPSGISNTE